MADEPEESEKTEEPSQKKLDDAANRGDFAKSQEANMWFALAASTVVVLMLAEPLAKDVFRDMRGLLSHAHDVPTDTGGLKDLFWRVMLIMATVLGLPLAVMLAAALGGHYMQHGLSFTTDQMEPKFSKISPMAGAKRLFSTQSLMNLGKALLKLVVVGTVVALVMWPDRHQLEATMTMDPVAMVTMSHDMIAEIFIAVLILFTVIAGLDFAYQRYTWYEKQKMTLKEVKDEFKNTEGDPHVKSRLRQIRMERMRKRMMAAVPEATVVVTNPTHYAVALKYETGMAAPVCVAKGADLIALKIREIAKTADVPVVENPALARALYASVEIDREVPVEHYKAVAEVIGFVFRLRGKRPPQG